MGLQQRLRSLEELLGTVVPDAALTAEEVRRGEVWLASANAVLVTMPPGYARAIVAELESAPKAPEVSAITRRVVQLADSTVPAHLHAHRLDGCACSNHYRRPKGPLAMPESLCALLEAHGDAVEFAYYNCRDCGYESGEWTYTAARAHCPLERGCFTHCPLCGGPVGRLAYEARHGFVCRALPSTE